MAEFVGTLILTMVGCGACIGYSPATDPDLGTYIKFGSVTYRRTCLPAHEHIVMNPAAEYPNINVLEPFVGSLNSRKSVRWSAVPVP